MDRLALYERHRVTLYNTLFHGRPNACGYWLLEPACLITLLATRLLSIGRVNSKPLGVLMPLSGSLDQRCAFGRKKKIKRPMSDSPQVDRTSLSVIPIEEQGEDEKLFWLRKSPHEILEAVERTRRILYGYDPTTVRL